MAAIIIAASFLVFAWSVVGIIRPTWARLPNRIAAVGVWAVSVVLLVGGAILMPPSDEDTAPGAVQSVTSRPNPNPSSSTEDAEWRGGPAQDRDTNPSMRELQERYRNATLAEGPDLVHADSSFRSEVNRLIGSPPLAGHVTRAQAFHNDLEVWVDAELTGILGLFSCDQQRNYAASLWQRWSGMGVGAGAGIEIKSYTGRTIASAEEGFTGARFHC